jgi:hypothetical protein
MGNSQKLTERNATWLSSAPAFAAGRRRGPAAKSRSSEVTRSSVGRASAGLKPSRHPASTEITDMSDFQIADQGTIFLIRPLNEAARQWLDENVVSEPWQWVQGALCVEARFARDLIIEIEEAGFEISH